MTQPIAASKSLALPVLVLVGMASFAVGMVTSATPSSDPTATEVLRGNGYAEPIPSQGPLDAPVVLVEAVDYNCVWCGLGLPGRAHGQAPFIKRILAEHEKDVLFVLKHFLVFRRSPVTREASERSSVAALAAQRQGRFWEYHDMLFQHIGETWDADTLKTYADALGLDTAQFLSDLQDPVLLQHVRLDDAAAQAVGVSGTPSLFINGLKVPNGARADEIRRLIHEARDQVLDLLQTEQATTLIEARRMATVQRAGETFARHFHDHDVVGLPVEDAPGLPPILNATTGGQ